MIVLVSFASLWLSRSSDDPYRDLLKQEGVIGRVSANKDVFVVTDDWLGLNLYRVQTYKPGDEEGKYVVSLIEVESPRKESFDSLTELFMETPLTLINNYNLAEGVNCQGMTCYLASWCRQTGHVYKVDYTATHTNITIEYQGDWYKFDFTEDRSITKIAF